MKRLSADVVVIGGGATGAGVVRDVAMRGWSAILVDKADLGQGTTGRYHGLLHSGGRYVVSDPHSATECALENAIITRIQPQCVEQTGGLFIVGPDDDPEYSDRFLIGARATGVPCEEISPAEALRREPRINPRLQRAFAVQDGAVDGWQMVWGAARSAMEYGAQVLTYHRVTDVLVRDAKVVGVVATDEKRGEQVQIDCSFVLNAGGPWAGQIATMAGCEQVEVVPGRGIMIAMNHRLVNSVVNRCIHPADGDILVPVHTVSIIGTTDVRADDPDRLPIPREEVQQMLDAGEVLVPGFRESRAVHAWSGARPLFKDPRVSATDTRHMTRGMSILRHDVRDGIGGIISIIGGKLTTYRLMAEKMVDAMADQLGETRPCRTADEVIDPPGSSTYHVTHRLEEREGDRLDDQIICECELMNRGMLTELMAEQPTANFDDLRRQLRLGMGPCQGGFCSMRATGIAVQEKMVDVERASELMRLFLKNRWIGLWPILHGDQVRQTALDNWIFHGTFDLEALPESQEVAL
ncbi:anaerobic glycerol-3-phosphate dehydrogenase subunit GlpA [Aestuariimicrobium ganziense]|uniref:anaerobic glycerol-3-phosphate dehydrogenase subunit GlpA n=1 Tax=Aestuariimicrobium ganziense TaxID=2773677 RepID=UPI0019416A9E|nr:anaerobic glycerol-3-phosphate dehydrogenase subunit GlpA [Aestuariimicrobium ganziense]